MRVIKLDSLSDFKKLLRLVGSTKEGIEIMKKKMKIELFYIKDLKTPAANILKQDALSVGAELAVEKNTILCKNETVDSILIVNEKQREALIKKEKIQPFGLKELSVVLDSFKPKEDKKVEIMGVINANDDSFYIKSRFKDKKGVDKIMQMVEEGADIIDIGGVSSRPGSSSVSEEEELLRIKTLIDVLYEKKIYERVNLSIDSYAPKPIAYALERGFKIVNDITGLQNDEVCKLCARFNAKAVIMHMQKNPKQMQQNPTYDHVITDIDDFFYQRVGKAEKYGIKDIILDVGIGFGKTLEHNLILIKHLNHFLHFNLPLLIGASRKSMIDKIVSCDVKQRLPGTIALHLKAIEQGATIIRCHDVKEHYQAIKVQKALQETLI